MNTNLKTIMLTLIAGLAFIVCADESARTSAMDETAPAPAVAAADQAPSEKKAKPRRTRRVKKDKATAPADGKRKPARCRRTRKMDTAEIHVTGMLDSAE